MALRMDTALMTIMFAGGMTIAIPGETPVAVAQTGMLSVSATAAPGNSFGGSQIIEIVVDDPSRSETSNGISRPDVTVDGTGVTMTQADTGKWYAYFSANTDTDTDTDTFTPPTGATVAVTDPQKEPDGIADINGVVTLPFDDDSDIDVVLGDEVITLHYEQDLDDLATIRTDRTGVPENGQVHVTVSDFRLNLDPTGEDRWIMYTNGEAAEYANADVTTPLTVPIDDTDDWVGAFGGLGGKFKVTADDKVVDIANVTDVEYVILTETGTNTGVFESQGDNDLSNIMVTGVENDVFTIAYADSDVQVFIESFDTALEMITDGTWDSGESLTVRLTNENLNLNTLTEQKIVIGNDDIPVLVRGDPVTLKAAEIDDGEIGESISVNDAHVATLNATGLDTTITVTLTDDQLTRLTNNTLNHYTHVLSNGLDITTNAELEGLIVPITDGLTAINMTDGAASTFTVTFTAEADAFADGVVDANTAIYDTVTAAVDAVDVEDSNAASVKAAAEGADTDAPEEFRLAIEAIDATNVAGVLAAVNEAAEEHIVPTSFTVVVDIFSFGASASDAVYRALLEETDSASGVFEATIEYQVLNQRTVDMFDAPESADVMSDELAMVLDTGYTGGDAPEFTYDDDNASKDAPTNTGEVSVDAATYSVSDDVTITLVDADLNTDSGAREIYRIASDQDTIKPTVVSIAIGNSVCASDIKDVSLRETASDSGIFEGSFTVPAECGDTMTTGESITVTYVDFRDENGGDSEWTDSATIGADTGSVSLDRTVYPVPRAADAVDGLEATQVTITVSVDDADEDTSSSSKQTISGVELKVAGVTIDLGELKETEPDSGIFESTVTVDSHANRDNDNNNNRIEQGDIITVKYTDESDASGNINSVSDSATFDLRNAVLQSDKSVYVIGQDALLTLIEADLNLDSGTIDNIGLDRINWDSDAYDGSLDAVRADLGPVPTNLRETGENTGIFQVVITISDSILGEALERGEEITLAYTDNGPSGADYVGDDERDVELQIETSNFGATVELDQNVYTWTDKVFITVVASDYNFDSNIVDEIGSEDKGEITIRTRADELKYRLAETGPDTGVFTGELVLTGDASFGIDGVQGTTSDNDIAGPTDGTIKTRTSDGISISFDYSDSEAPLVASALIRWNVGEVQWLEASYAATGSGVVRIIDPDMNINPDAVDSIEAVVYSETFIGGIELTLTETQEASGIFEGTVEFDPESASDGHRLQVTEGDIITASYEDKTLPKPDNGDTLEITATTLIGSIVPPLERAPASNPAIVDAFGSSLASVSVDQQVQITADLTSGQDRDQDFAFLVQIQNEDGVTVELSWIAGTLGGGATFNAAQSWTPSETGSYTATIFVWESVSNPTALSPQLSITIDVV